MKDDIERLLAMLCSSPDTETFDFVVKHLLELFDAK
jgi:hypothetical protein